jgi:hypothetical protein
MTFLKLRVKKQTSAKREGIALNVVNMRIALPGRGTHTAFRANTKNPGELVRRSSHH